MPSTEAMRLFVKILEEEDPGWYSRVPAFDPQPVVHIEMHEDANTVPASTNGTPSVPEPENGSSVKIEDKIVILEGLNTVSAHEEWTALAVSGQLSEPRYEHGAIILQDKMYIFGGNRNERYLRDLQFCEAHCDYAACHTYESPTLLLAWTRRGQSHAAAAGAVSCRYCASLPQLICPICWLMCCLRPPSRRASGLSICGQLVAKTIRLYNMAVIAYQLKLRFPLSSSILLGWPP